MKQARRSSDLDTAAMLDACHGRDVGAPYDAPHVARPYVEEIKTPPRRLKVAVCKTTLHGLAIHPECVAAVEAAAQLCVELGHEVIEAKPSFDFDKAVLAWTKVVACGTALSVRLRAQALGREPGSDDIEPATRGALEYGGRIGGTDYLQSLNIIHATGRQIAQFFETHDILVTATLAEPPARIGRFAMSNPDFLDYRIGPNGIIHYSPFASIFNMTGQPAASIPLHWSKDGLPVGTHFAAKTGDEATLLKLAAQLEQARSWFGKRPALADS